MLFEHLTTKQLKLVRLVTRGMTNQEIATEWETTEQVIKNYLHEIYEKLYCSSRLELAMWFTDHEAKTMADEFKRLLDTPGGVQWHGEMYVTPDAACVHEIAGE